MVWQLSRITCLVLYGQAVIGRSRTVTVLTCGNYHVTKSCHSDSPTGAEVNQAAKTIIRNYACIFGSTENSIGTIYSAPGSFFHCASTLLNI